MATYAIGDLQGCRAEFEALLAKLQFGDGDHLWLLGDLVNRGADSLGTLRLAKSIALSGRQRCTVVLGNHDLHFLAIYYAGHKASNSDTFDELLDADDVAELADWLCRQRMLHVDSQLGYCMSHAGLPHIWTLPQAMAYASEVEAVLTGHHSHVTKQQFFREMYGNKPPIWSEQLQDMPRVRCITNYLTRMRLINAAGQLDFDYKGPLQDAPAGWNPWYELTAANNLPCHLLFGHWAALDGVTGVQGITALDTGCVWGRKLTALCLETGELTSVNARPTA